MYIRKQLNNKPCYFKKVPVKPIHNQLFDSFFDRENPNGIMQIFRYYFPIIGKKHDIVISFLDYKLVPPLISEDMALLTGVSRHVTLEIYCEISYLKKHKLRHTIIVDEICALSDSGGIIINGVTKILSGQINRAAGPIMTIFKSGSSASGNNCQLKIMPGLGLTFTCEGSARSGAFFYMSKKRKYPISLLPIFLTKASTEYYLKHCKHMSDPHLSTLPQSVFKFYALFGKTVKFSVVDNVVIPEKGTNEEELYVFDKHLDRTVFGISEYAFIAKDVKVGSEVVKVGTLIKSISKNILSSLKEIKVFCFYKKYQMFAQSYKSHDCESAYKSLEVNHVIFGIQKGVEDYTGVLDRSFVERNGYVLSTVAREAMSNLFIINKEASDNSFISTDYINSLLVVQKMVRGEQEDSSVQSFAIKYIRGYVSFIDSCIKQGLAKLAMTIEDGMFVNVNMTFDPGDILKKVSEYVAGLDINSQLREYIYTSNLIQYREEANPLSMVSHERSITSLGQGGINKFGPNLEARDMHSSQDGYMCIIETPEGRTGGLKLQCASLCTLSDQGFLESPFYRVVDGVVQYWEKPSYLTSLQAKSEHIIDFDKYDKDGKVDARVEARYMFEKVIVPSTKVTFAEVANDQVFSINASLIPFINQDDPRRSLMAVNFIKQALPLLKREIPIVGTGNENLFKYTTGYMRATVNGTVTYVDSRVVIITDSDGDMHIHEIKKYDPTNMNTPVNYSPIVKRGDKVKLDDVIADGFLTKGDQLALGVNLLVTFGSFDGRTFEDSFIVSKSAARSLSSVAVNVIKSFVYNNDVPQLLTREIPDVNASRLANLDEMGIIKKGSYVRSGDIVVGKVVKSSETSNIDNPEMRMLRDIISHSVGFDYVNVSDVVPSGKGGTVISVKVVSRADADLIASMEEGCRGYLEQMVSSLAFSNNMSTQNVLNSTKLMKSLNASLDKWIEKYKKMVPYCRDKNTIMQHNVSKIVYVYTASVKDLVPGDKLAGRHGNKGVVSQILPDHDMPYDDQGNIADLVISVFSFPSRMNYGQINETYLGRLSYILSKRFSKWTRSGEEEKIVKVLEKVFNYRIDESKGGKKYKITKKNYKDYLDLENMNILWSAPAFNTWPISFITGLAKDLDVDLSPQRVWDGKTGIPMSRKMPFGSQYFMRLNHNSEGKMHARCVGPYSLITQQPISGKPRMGGMRVGDMECAAFEAYQAGENIKEMFTIKSDDMVGRVRAFENKVFAKPVSFYVSESVCIFTMLLRSLNIDIRYYALESSVKHLFKTRQKIVYKKKMYSRDGGIKEPLVDVTDFILSNYPPENLKIRSVEFSVCSAKKYSTGHVTRAETLNYRKGTTERGGIHCEALCGPKTNYRCACGKISSYEERGTVCPDCGVTITLAKQRRRMQPSIKFPCSFVHPLMLDVYPYALSYLTGLSQEDTMDLVHLKKYIASKDVKEVDKNGETVVVVKKRTLILSIDFYKKYDKPLQESVFLTGAKAIEWLLSSIDLNKMAAQLRDRVIYLQHSSKKTAKHKDKIRTIKNIYGYVMSFIKSGKRPEEVLIFDELLLTPSELRPILALSNSGRYVSSDMNGKLKDIVANVIRLNKILTLDFPAVMINNEINILQRDIHAIFDSKAVRSPAMQQKRSLLCELRGKLGMIRGNMCGKRVDYSARSVIIVGPYLNLDQCGIPIKILVVLFKPEIYRALLERNLVSTYVEASSFLNEFVDRGGNVEEIVKIINDVVVDIPIFFNRAPTLHRMGCQAFYPVPINGCSVSLDPIVCDGFNADFDGDQTTITRPLTLQAIREAKSKMMSSNNIMSVANGKVAMGMTQDLVLGLYYLTVSNFKEMSTHVVSNERQVKLLMHRGLELQRPIYAYIRDVKGKRFVTTTLGRLLVWFSLPTSGQVKIEFDIFNEPITKKKSEKIICHVFEVMKSQTKHFLDKMKKIGFRSMFRSGISIYPEMFDIRHGLDVKVKEIKEKIEKYRDRYLSGYDSYTEYSNKVLFDSFNFVESMENETISRLKNKLVTCDTNGINYNDIYMMHISGARGTKSQLCQIAVLKGLMTKPSGDIVLDIISSPLSLGLTKSEYLISVHGKRKGIADILKTATAGYLNRKVRVATDHSFISRKDCGTEFGLDINIRELSDVPSLIVGRTLLRDVNFANGDVFPANTLCTRKIAEKIMNDFSVEKIVLRSAITCCAPHNRVCQMCYGTDLSTQKFAELRYPSGVIATQSIGEPGTQLTMRTFHVGGAAQSTSEVMKVRSIVDCKVDLSFVDVAVYRGENVCISLNGFVKLVNESGQLIQKISVGYGDIINYSHGENVAQGVSVVEKGDGVTHYYSPGDGVVEHCDLINGLSCQIVKDEIVKIESMIVTEDFVNSGDKIYPRLVIKLDTGDVCTMPLLTGTRVFAKHGQIVKKGFRTHTTPRMTVVKTGDISGGLNELSSILENRKGDNGAICKHDGVVRINIKNTNKTVKYVIKITDPEGESLEKHIVSGTHILAYDGQKVNRGDQLTRQEPSYADVAAAKGFTDLCFRIISEIQDIYINQGILVNIKHIEIVVKVMLKSIKILNAPTNYPYFINFDGSADLCSLIQYWSNRIKKGEKTTSLVYEQMIMGITKSVTSVLDSPLAALCLENIKKGLIISAVSNLVDNLKGSSGSIIIDQTPASSNVAELKLDHDSNTSDKAFNLFACDDSVETDMSLSAGFRSSNFEFKVSGVENLVSSDGAPDYFEALGISLSENDVAQDSTEEDSEEECDDDEDNEEDDDYDVDEERDVLINDSDNCDPSVRTADEDYYDPKDGNKELPKKTIRKRSLGTGKKKKK